MSNTKRFLIGILVAALLAMVSLLAACSGEKPKPGSTPEMVRGIVLVTTQRIAVPDYVEATGTVRAAQSAQLASQVLGTITHVGVHEGDRVRRGQVLITIERSPAARCLSERPGRTPGIA
jgi:multidrug efflux pump subunit AcrA (membrane-fusion protein)